MARQAHPATLTDVYNFVGYIFRLNPRHAVPSLPLPQCRPADLVLHSGCLCPGLGQPVHLGAQRDPHLWGVPE